MLREETRPTDLIRPDRLRDFYTERRQGIRDWLHGYTDAAGLLRADLWRNGLAHADTLARTDLISSGAELRTRQAAGAWRELGPAPLYDPLLSEIADAGEVVGIAIDPRGTSDQVLYLATGHGGVWKSADGGACWRPLTDRMPSLSMGAVELHRYNPDIVYAGTGNPFESNGGSSFRGIGIYKSMDGGESWSLKGEAVFGPTSTRPGKLIYRMRTVIPFPDLLLVATDQGLYRSSSGGERFGANRPGFDDGLPVLAGDVTDLAIDPTGAGTVYAAVAGVGVLRSTDFGQTFPVNLFLNADGTSKPGAPARGHSGFISFAQSTLPSSATMYCSVAEAGEAGYLGLFKSTDGGATWSKPSTAAEERRKQVRYDQTIGVDPQDPERIWLGFIDLWSSSDGGRTLQEAGQNFVHADHHCAVFSPRSHWRGAGRTPLYVGTDGGVYVFSATSGRWEWQSLNRGEIGNAICTKIGMGRNDTRYTYAGVWDHGAAAHGPEDPGRRWSRGAFGDGGAVGVDPFDARTCYQTVNSGFFKTTDGGRSWAGVAGLPATPNRLFFVPFEPAGTSSAAATPYATCGERLFTIDPPAQIASFPSGINAAAASLRAPYAVWAALYDGSVWRSDDIRQGTSAQWIAVSQPGPAQVAAIAVHPRAAHVACVVYQGFSGAGAGSSSRHAFLTFDSGATWTDISGTPGGGSSNLPDLPLYDVAFVDEGIAPASGMLPRIVVAGDAGVMITSSTSASSPAWRLLGTGLPRVQCNSLQIKSERGLALLRVGTWGRGVHEWGDPPPTQRNWRWCNRCQGLFYGGRAASGVCPAGGAHDRTGSGDYSLMHEAAADPGQHNWRWCRRCEGLFFAGNASSRCPAGGAHDGGASGDYSVSMSLSLAGGQRGWRWCNRCQGLFFGGNQSLGRCPAGGAHATEGSGEYVLYEL